MNSFYEAPWETNLLVTTVLASATCLGLGAFLIWYGRYLKRLALRQGPEGRGNKRLGGLFLQAVGVAEIALVIPFGLLTVRGYTVTAEAIQVHRLAWKTDLPLAPLQSIEAEPNAMRESARTLGNGGFFAYSGHWRNQLLGDYRALVTDRERTVVLKYEAETVVVSPVDPDRFVSHVERRMKKKGPE